MNNGKTIFLLNTYLLTLTFTSECVLQENLDKCQNLNKILKAGCGLIF